MFRKLSVFALALGFGAACDSGGSAVIDGAGATGGGAAPKKAGSTEGATKRDSAVHSPDDDDDDDDEEQADTSSDEDGAVDVIIDAAADRQSATGGAGGQTGDPAHQSGGPPVGPEIAADCPGDPTDGWTEYTDTFRVQRPYDLTESQRFSFEGGVFTFWVLPTDKAHQPGNTTAPRTEARWSNFGNTRPHMFSADMMFEKPSNHVTIMQVHTTGSGAGPVYLRVDDGNIHPLNGPVFVSGLYDKWFNLKVAIDPGTLQATIWINNCQKVKGVIGPRGSGVNYFKNGVYTCTSAVCRDHYKNIHLYQK